MIKKMKNNSHLIPNNVQDIVEQLIKVKDLNGSEHLFLIQRLEAIRDYCDANIVAFNLRNKKKQRG